MVDEPFMTEEGIHRFAVQIAKNVCGQPLINDDNDFIVYKQELQNGFEIGRDMDVLLGFTTSSDTPVTVALRIANIEVSRKTIHKWEFESPLEHGRCIPLTSLENYKVAIAIHPENAQVECFIGRLKNIRMRMRVKEQPWKYISFTRGFFLVRCSNLHIQHITHVRDFEHIPELPNIEAAVQRCIDDWRKQKCNDMVDTILEELMKKTWHPSRHIDWCLDMEDREMFGFKNV